MAKNNYVFEKKMINNDEWHIHYLRLDEGIVKITCDLMRSNRKFWQSKTLWSDWTVCSQNNANLLRTFAYDVIANYYDRQRNIEKFDEFFENPIDK